MDDTTTKTAAAKATVLGTARPADPMDIRPPRVIVGRYFLFAIVSIVSNLGTQKLVEIFSPDEQNKFFLYLSLLAGTAVGFSSRYVLDKKWVFYDSYDGHFDEMKKLILYAIFAGVVTLIFWTFELGAFYIFGTEAAKFTGATIGLIVGFVVKYFLDKSFVFRVGSATVRAVAKTAASVHHLRQTALRRDKENADSVPSQGSEGP